MSEVKHDHSFVLSPGRKALSMSNLIAEQEESTRMRKSSGTSSGLHNGSQLNISTSQSNLHRMKAFLSSRNLDHAQISLSVGRIKSRNSIGSDSALSVLSKSRDFLHPQDSGKYFFQYNISCWNFV